MAGASVSIHRPRRFAASIAFALTLLSGGTARAASFTGLGFLPGGSFTRAMATSSDGSVVVGVGGILGGAARGFRWTEAGGLEGISALPLTTYAYSVSGDGVVAGGYTESAIDSKAFTFTESGGADILFARGTLWAGSADGSAFAGDALDGGTHQHHAVRWSTANGSRSIEPDNVTINFSRALGIDATGTRIVGEAAFPGLPAIRAFVWDATNGMVNIGNPDFSGGSSRADAISADAGTIVGTAMPGGSGNSIAARWDASGGPQYLDDRFGLASEAYGVSADGGTIVGTRSGQAFVWTAASGMIRLKDLLGPLAEGWTLDEARGVSADGQIVVGWGHDPVGLPQAWRAELPPVVLGVEPSAPGRNALRLAIAPNPSRGPVRVLAFGARSADTRAEVLDLAGRVVAPLGTPSGSPASWSWDGRTRDGTRAVPGVYVVRVREGTTERVARLMRLGRQGERRAPTS